jgi:RNA polymerase sigma factor (sigma-70 family)
MYKPLSDLHDLTSHIAIFDSENSYRQLFKSLFPAVYRFCHLLLKSGELAEEAACDVMIVLWRKREKLPEIQDVRIYSFIVARDLSLKILNKNTGKKLVSLDNLEIDILLNTGSSESLLIDDELKEKLEFSARTLSAHCKLVFRLIREFGLSYKETAAVLNISVESVDFHLITAFKKLTPVLKAEFKLM